ncbi:MAG: OsmC family peroxiredoxin [Chloroflexota bacterium]|nr:MAG: OsmC family peroxiredoxin [Chloroflexota bacterium]
MEAKVTWKGRLSFEGVSDSGFTLPLGSDPSVGGDNDGFRPMELMAIGLAGCTAMDVISILQKKQQEVTGFEVRAHIQRSHEHPKVFTHVIIEYIFEGNHIDPEAVERAIELSENKYCPAQAMMAKAVTIEHRYEIIEALGSVTS